MINIQNNTRFYKLVKVNNNNNNKTLITILQNPASEGDNFDKTINKLKKYFQNYNDIIPYIRLNIRELKLFQHIFT